MIRMFNIKMIIAIGLTAALLQGFSTAKDGYIDQIITKDDISHHNIIVTDWSKLKPLEGVSKDELAIFRCMIAAQMLEAGMKREDYLEYLNEKGIIYEMREPFDTKDSESAWELFFSERLSLLLFGDPITHATIAMETPFEVGGYANVPVDINNTISPYQVISEDTIWYPLEMSDFTIAVPDP